MQTIKPFALGLQTRCIEYRRRIGMSVTAAVYFPFKPKGEGTAWSEMSMWTFLGGEMPEGPMIDEGVVKLRSEYLVRGRAFPPNAPAPGCEVRAKVGPLEKRLHVFGTRAWIGREAQAPQPFESLPIDWAHTYGGPDFPANPLGMGRALSDVGGIKLQLLPHVELPAKPIARPDQVGEPATFGITDMTWPQRAQYRGTYDEAWFKEQSPGFASDLDWRFFNLAQPDQWFDSPPKGDEAFAFANMHPSKPLIEGVLPGLRARCFTCYDKADPAGLRELPLRLTTLWFFPHAERGVMLFQGLAECKEDDGGDIALLVGALERLGETKSDAHYATVVGQRLDPKLGSLHALRESDLLPSGLKGADPLFEATLADYEPEGLMAQAGRRGAEMKVDQARAEVKARGMDPDKLGVKMPPVEKKPTLEELPDYVQKKQAEALNVQVNALLDAGEQAVKARAQAAAAGIDLEALVHRGPPVYRAAAHLAQLVAAVPAGAKAADGKPIVDAAALKPKLVQLEALERSNYLATAHAQPPARPMDPQRAQRLREEVKQGHAQGKSFLGVDFTGADLSGLDLSGADFTAAWLESVNFKGAILNGACFAHAVLAHANLEAVDAEKADFTGANLGKSNLKTARLRQADLTAVTLMDTALAETDFRGARLDHAKLLGATYGLADWRHVKASGLFLHKAVLQGMVLRHAELLQPVFVECDLGGVDFGGAKLDRPSFTQCKGEGARFVQADMKGAVFVQDCDFSKADFSQAQLAGSNLRGTRLVGAVMRQARLDQGDVSEADLSGADLKGASAIGVLAIKTRFCKARLAQVNLMDAILQRADLSGADVRDANLFGADLSRVAMDPQTLLGGSMLKRTRTHPRRSLPPTPAGAA
jgi:uncharacterized protein YjbI with pentapeptide repeats